MLYLLYIYINILITEQIINNSATNIHQPQTSVNRTVVDKQVGATSKGKSSF